MQLFSWILIFAFFFTNQIDAKIRLLTFHYNLPELIEIQHKTLKKFIKDDYELIVFNDARDPNTVREINEICNKYNILCVRFEPEWHLIDPLNERLLEWGEDPNIYSHIGSLVFTSEEGNLAVKPRYNHPSIRHCHVIQYALDKFGYDHNDIVGILDGDCFPVRPISLRSLIADNDIVGIKKYVVEDKLDYLWVVFILFNPETIPHKEDLNFHVDLINNKVHDTGSHTYHFLKDHPDAKYFKFQGESSSGFYDWNDKQLKNYGFYSNEIAFIRDLDSLKNFPWPITVEFHVNNHFIHLGNSSFGLPGQREKINCVNRFLERTLNEMR